MQSLRSASRWVWALLALALIWFALALYSAPTFDIPVAYSAFIGAAPALFSAALMFVAPRERLIRVAAFCFALPIAVNAVIGGAILIISRLGENLAYLGPRLAGVASAFGIISWAFPIVAVFAIAIYIGPVRSRAAWILVIAGVVSAVLQASAIVASAPAGVSPGDLLTAVLTQAVWIAWAYLLAVVVGESFWLFALAAASNLISGLVTFVALTLLQPTLAADPTAALPQTILAILWILGLISWVALLGGILRELPRVDLEYETGIPQRALSVGR